MTERTTTVHLTRTDTPEERELVIKWAALAALLDELAERELELATSRAALHAFEQRYLTIVGARFAEADALEAEIAEALSRLRPSETAQQQATEARAQATHSADALAAMDPAAGVAPPSDTLKSLFREMAKRVHPDLAIDEADRAKRTARMAEINRAYGEGDEHRLRELLSDWETSPEAVTGEGVAAELVRTIRRIHQIDQRLAALRRELETLRGSELSALKARVDAEQLLGRDLLAQMAAEVTVQIERLRRRRDELKTPTGQP